MRTTIKNSLMALALCLFPAGVSAQSAETADPNFHIYLCFGQSNMEGNAQWESVDNQVDSRFQMLATCNFSSPQRTLGKWYTAKCPIVSPDGKLGPTDYFGRTMVAAMPADVKIGVVAVAMGGSPIEMFDKDKYQQKMQQNPSEWWVTLAKRHYGGNPYGRLIEMAKKAQEAGVIKGILLHQGCSNNGDPNWPSMVKKIYNDMLNDLGLSADSVPLFAGETLRQDQGGSCYGHNTQVNRLPQVIPTAHVVSSLGLPGNGQDPWHFNAAGYRTLGKRYAYAMLQTMNRPTQMDENYQMSTTLKKFYLPKSFDTTITAKANSAVTLSLMCTFTDGHQEDLSQEVTFTSTDFSIINGKVKAGGEGSSGKVTATYTDFFGTAHEVTIVIEVPDGDGLGQKYTNVASLFGKEFAIVNEEEGKALFGSTDQNLAYDSYENAFVSTNTGFRFKIESLSANADPAVRRYYLIRLIQPDGTPYSIWDKPGYLNSQPADQWCSFILGLNDQNGEDMQNGAVWEIKYVKDKGFTLRNIGTGLYLHDAAPAKYDTPAYFTFCTLSAKMNVEAVRTTMPSDAVYTLQGVKVGTMEQWDALRRGLYIVNGKIVRK